MKLKKIEKLPQEEIKLFILAILMMNIENPMVMLMIACYVIPKALANAIKSIFESERTEIETNNIE